MKQTKKSELSRLKILEAAIEEFSGNAFEKVSISTMCEKNNLSKGLVYHNFGGKDEIYLACVEQTFHTMSEYLAQNVIISENDSGKAIEQCFSVRYSFFTSNPHLKNIFYSAIFQPPTHLKARIKELHKNLDALNDDIAEKILPLLTLRCGLDIDEVREYISAFDAFYYTYFTTRYLQNDAGSENMDVHDLYGKRALEFLIYGIAGKK